MFPCTAISMQAGLDKLLLSMMSDNSCLALLFEPVKKIYGIRILKKTLPGLHYYFERLSVCF